MQESRIRELVGEYVVETYPANGRVYYTVTRKDSADLLAIGDEPTMEEALEQAKWAIREFGSSDSKAQTA